MRDKGNGWFSQLLLSPVCTCPCTYLGIPSPGVHLGLTCHFQGLQICQARQRAITDGVHHGAWKSGGPASEPVKSIIPVPSSLLFPVPSPMPWPSPLLSLPHPTGAIWLPFPCNLHPPYHTPSKPRPWGRTQHRAPACFIDAQDARLLAAHGGYRRVQATAARIVSLQLAEIHAAFTATTGHRNEVCRPRTRRAFFSVALTSGQSEYRTRLQ